jgi:hypothetical protein
MPAKLNSQSLVTFSLRCQELIREIAQEKFNGIAKIPNRKIQLGQERSRDQSLNESSYFNVGTLVMSDE